MFSVTGAVIETVDGNANVTITANDGDDRPISVTDAVGNVTQQSYDPAGNVISTTDAEGNVTEFTYSKDNEQTASLNAQGDETNSAYNQLGEQVAAYNGAGNGTFTGINADGESTGSGLATGSSSQTFYYANGQEGQFTDPDGNTTIFLTGLNGNAVGQISPLGVFSYVSYNADNQPTVAVDADGRSIDYSYNAAGLETAEVWLNAAGVQQNAVTYSYDNNGNVVSAGNDYGTYSLTLDAGGRLETQENPFGETLTFSYDNANNLTELQDSATGTQYYTYNAAELLSGGSYTGGLDSAQLSFSIGYTANLQISTIDRYSNSNLTGLVGTTTETYDKAGDMTEITDENSSSTILEQFQYTWNSAQLLTSETDTITGDGTTTNYGYDASDQLTSAGSNTYSYDANGNRTMTGYQTGPDNQLLTDGTWDYTYDTAGNLIQKSGVSGGPDAGIVWVYAYDNKNNMISAVETSGGTVVYQEADYFDVYGQQLEQDVTQSGTTTVTKFVYGPNANIIADLNSVNAVIAERVYLNAIDAVFARMVATGEDFYLTDHLGSIRGLENVSGSLDDAISYDAWGNETSQSNPSAGDRYTFQGGEWDSGTGIYHFGCASMTRSRGGGTVWTQLG